MLLTMTEAPWPYNIWEVNAVSSPRVYIHGHSECTYLLQRLIRSDSCCCCCRENKIQGGPFPGQVGWCTHGVLQHGRGIPVGSHQAFLTLRRMNNSSATHCLTAEVAKGRPEEVALPQDDTQRLLVGSTESQLLPDCMGAVLVLSATAWCPHNDSNVTPGGCWPCCTPSAHCSTSTQ